MDDLAVDDDGGSGHHPMLDDFHFIGDFGDADGNAKLRCLALNAVDGGFAALTAFTQYRNIHD